MKDKKRAQTITEYLLVWSLIIAAIIVGASVFIKPAVKTSTDKLIDVLGNEIQEDSEGWYE